MSPEKWPLARKWKFFWGWSKWESCSPGYTCDMPCWQKSRSLYKKIDFWPQISKFLGPKSTFLPLAANWSLTDQCFQHEKGVSLDSWYEGTKSFTPCPQKIAHLSLPWSIGWVALSFLVRSSVVPPWWHPSKSHFYLPHTPKPIHFLKAYDNSYSKMNIEHKYKDKDEYKDNDEHKDV